MGTMDAFRLAVAEKQGMFVVNVKYTRMTNTLVDVLRLLLNEREESGVLFSVDRPSAFLSQLLDRQGVPQDRLMYLDAVTNISGEGAPLSEKLELFSSPFCVNLFTEMVSCHSAKVAGGRKGFVLIDNLASLRPYMTNPCVERLVRALRELGKDSPGFKCVFVMDKASTPDLYDIVMAQGAQEVSL